MEKLLCRVEIASLLHRVENEIDKQIKPFLFETFFRGCMCLSGITRVLKNLIQLRQNYFKLNIGRLFLFRLFSLKISNKINIKGENVSNKRRKILKISFKIIYI